MSKLIKEAVKYLSKQNWNYYLNESEDSEVTKHVEKHTDDDVVHVTSTPDGHHVYQGSDPGTYYVHHKASGKTHGVSLDPEHPQDKVSKEDAAKINSKHAVAAIHKAHRDEYGSE